MQKFNQEIHKKFINYFKIQEKPSEIDRFFIDKTNKYISFIKWIPGLKMIWVWNSISMNTSNSESDIDLFIVTSKNRMWFVRILTTFIFMILWQRKTAKKHAWKFCLSFFCSKNWMDFSNFAIQDDIYLYFWIVYFKPILDFDDTYNKFIKSQSWANFWEYIEQINQNKSFINFSWKSIWNNCTIFDLFDKILKKIFLPHTLKNFESIWKPYWIIINDDMLKFHNNDIRWQLKKELLD